MPIAPHIFEAIKNNDATFTMLNLENKAISMEELQELATALRGNKTVTRLNLYYNKIGAKGMEVLAQALIVNDTIKELHLGSNELGPEGARLLATVLEANNTIASLNLGGNKLGTEGIAALAKGLAINQSVIYLNLHVNRIDAQGAKVLADTLVKNQTLKVIELHINKIGAEGAKAIADYLKTNKSLQKLNLCQNYIDAEGAIELADSLKVNETVTWVDISKNNIGAQGAKAIGAVIKSNKTLASIKLDNNYIEVEGANALLDGILNNHTITELSFFYTPLYASDPKHRISREVRKGIDEKLNENRLNAAALIKAALDGDFKGVRKLTKQGVAVNHQQKSDNNTALHFAAYRNTQNIFNYLRSQPTQQLLFNKKGFLPTDLIKTEPTTIKERWLQDLTVQYRYKAHKQIKLEEDSSQAEMELSYNVKIPFSFDNDDRQKVSNTIEKKEGNLCLFQLVIAYKNRNATDESRAYKFYRDQFATARSENLPDFYKANIHIKTVYLQDSNPVNKYFLNDLARYHPTRWDEIKAIANQESKSQFFQTFHHSEPAIYKYLEIEIKNIAERFIKHLNDEGINPEDIKVSFMLLDILSTKYQCHSCKEAAAYFQSWNSLFIEEFSKVLQSYGIRIPSRGLYMAHRYAAEEPCQDDNRPRQKHDHEIGNTVNIKEEKKNMTNLIIKRANPPILGEIKIPPIAFSNEKERNQFSYKNNLKTAYNMFPNNNAPSTFNNHKRASDVTMKPPPAKYTKQ